MKKVLLILTLFVITTSIVSAAAPQVFEKYWEKYCGVLSGVDDVRCLAIYPGGDLFATVDRKAQADAIKLFNLQSGQPNIKVENLAMTGSVSSVPAGLYNIVEGDFTDDGKFIACSLSYQASTPLKVYIWDSITTGPRMIYSSGAAWKGYRLGDAFDVIGSTADNSAKVLISGNGTTKPMWLTTADNGRTWTATDCTGTVQATAIRIKSDGTFYACRYVSGTNLQHYDATGVAIGTTPPDRIVMASPNVIADFTIDFDAGRIYSMGVNTATLGNSPLRVWDLNTGAVIASFTTDPIDLTGAFTGSANGSGSVAMMKTPGGGKFIYAMSERNGCARYSYSSQITLNAGGAYPDYTSLKAAIASFCPAGENTTATKPLIININPAVVIDTDLSLDDANPGKGDIVGDLVIKSNDPATKAVIQLRMNNLIQPTGTRDDGLWLYQRDNGVIMKNIVFCPSLTNKVTDDLVKIDENAPGARNWVEFWGCIFTDIDAAGTPYATTKAGCLVPIPGTRGSSLLAGDVLLKQWGDLGEDLSTVYDDCAVYGAPAGSWAAFIFCDGKSGEQSYINNMLFGYNIGANTAQGALQFGRSNAANPTGYFRISGTDAGAGPLSSTAFIGNKGWHAMYVASGSDTLVKIDNLLVLQTAANGNGRGYAGSGWADMQMRDSIINVSTLGVSDSITNYPETPSILERVTIHNNASSNAVYITGGTQTMTLKDCMFSGAGTKIADASAGGTAIVNAINCGFVLDGPNKATAIGAGLDSNLNSVRFDPIYANTTDATLANFLDIRSPLYAGKSSTGGNLVGGADYIGDATPAVCSVIPANHDFGSFLVNDEPTTFTFIVGNTGVEPLYIYGAVVNGSTDFSVDKAPTSPLAATTTDTMIIRYEPLTHGAQSANVEINCSIVGTPKLVPVNAVADYPTKVADWKLFK